ncbi:LURP-one-related 10-like protein [Tanacetum coccineum]
MLYAFSQAHSQPVCALRTQPVCALRTQPVCALRTQPVCALRTQPSVSIVLYVAHAPNQYHAYVLIVICPAAVVKALPKMSLIASDFNYLPDVKVPGVRAPLVSTKMHKKYTVHSVAIGKDTFVVTLNPNVDHAFIVTLIVILHEINEEKDAAM